MHNFIRNEFQTCISLPLSPYPAARRLAPSLAPLNVNSLSHTHTPHHAHSLPPSHSPFLTRTLSLPLLIPHSLPLVKQKPHIHTPCDCLMYHSTTMHLHTNTRTLSLFHTRARTHSLFRSACRKPSGIESIQGVYLVFTFSFFSCVGAYRARWISGLYYFSLSIFQGPIKLLF